MKVGRIFNVLRRVDGKNVNARLLGQVVNGELVIWWERLKAYLDAFCAISIATHAKVICAVGKDLIAKRMIKLSGKRSLINGPASESVADSENYEKIEAPGIAVPARESEADKNIFIVLKANFIAYKRAAVNYIINIYTSRLSTLISSVGAVARGTKAIKIVRKSGLLAAGGRLSSALKKITIKRKADFKAVTGRLLSTLKKTALKNTAALISGEAPPGTEAKKAVFLETKREATTGTGAETEAKKKLFITVRAAFIAYNRAAAIYLHNIFTSRLSGLITGAGAIAESRRTLQQGQTSEAGAADSENVTSRSGFTVESEAEVGHALPEDINASDTVLAAVLSRADHAPAETLEITAEEKADCGAEFAYWIYPEETADGGLIIRQVYFAKEIDDGLEVK